MSIESQEYYREVLTKHKEIIAKTRSIIDKLLDEAEADLASIVAMESELNESIQPHEELLPNNSREEIVAARRKYIWGEKETISSAISKLSQLLIKILPLELDIAKQELTPADIQELEGQEQNLVETSEDDKEIITAYLKRHGYVKRKKNKGSLSQLPLAYTSDNDVEATKCNS